MISPVICPLSDLGRWALGFDQATRAIGKRSKISVEPEDWDEALIKKIPGDATEKNESFRYPILLYIQLQCSAASTLKPENVMEHDATTRHRSCMGMEKKFYLSWGPVRQRRGLINLLLEYRVKPGAQLSNYQLTLDGLTIGNDDTHTHYWMDYRHTLQLFNVFVDGFTI